MFFNGFIQRKLAALLQPWLRGHHELQLKLGLLRSNGALTNIAFDTAALNELLDDPSKLCFKEVTVDHVSLQFTPFSSAAFTLVVRGVRVVLSLGDEEDEGGRTWRRRLKTTDTLAEERNKVLKDIDPEGCALHDAIKKISDISTRTWRDSLWNTVTKHCQLLLEDVNVLLQYPCMYDVALCSLYLKKFGAASQILGHRCFIRGFMKSFYLPFEESSFDVDFSGFEITLNSQNRRTTVFPATNMSVLVNLNNLQSMNFSFHVPALNFIFSPADLSVIMLLYGLLSRENKFTRPGRQLWNIVANKISFLLPTSKLSLVKVVRSASLWLKYSTTYHSILLQVGYPSDEVMRRSAMLMFHDTRYSKSVRSQWKSMAVIENELPSEEIAVARRISREKVLSSSLERKFQSTRAPSILRQLLVLILGTIGSLLVSLMRVFFLDKVLALFCGSSLHSGSVSENLALHKSVTLKVQEISISISPDDVLQSSVHAKAVSNMGISYQDLLSFRFSVDELFIRYLEKISENSLTFSTGCLNAHSFLTAKAGASNRLKQQQKMETDQRQIIIRAEPAQIINFPEAISEDGDDIDDVARTSVPQLDCLLGNLWSKWKNLFLTSESENIPNMLSPWLLCNMWSCLVDKGTSGSGSQVDCSFIVGKLNFNLEYYSFASAVVLLRCLHCALDRRREIVLHVPETTIQDQPAGYLSSKFASYSNKIRMDIPRILPAKHVQIGALIAGPTFGISLSNNHFHGTVNPSHPVTRLSFEICKIELLVSPNVKDFAGLLSDRGPEDPGLIEPQEMGYSDSGNRAYSCQEETSLCAYLNFDGLKAYTDESTESRKNQIIDLRPTTANLKYVRKDHYSLGTSLISVSAVLHWVVTGFSCLIFLDELYVLTKVVFGVLYESHALRMNLSGRDLSREAASGRDTTRVESESGYSVSRNHGSHVTYPKVFLNGKLELNSLDMVLHKSRKSYISETYTNTLPTDRETGNRSAVNDISHNGIYITMKHSVMEFIYKGQEMDVTIDTTGFRCIIFRYLAEFHGTSDKSELKNLLHFLDFLTEASVSHSKFCFCLRNLDEAVPSTSLCYTAVEPSSHGTESLRDHWLSVKIVISQIYMAGCPLKDILVHDFEEFNAAFSVGGDFQAISCECKGGSLLLEAKAVTMFNECFTLYYQWVSKLRSSGRITAAQDISKMASVAGNPCISRQQVQCQEATRDGLDALCMRILHLSLILVERHETGRIQELLLEVDFHINLEVLNTVRKITIRDSKFSLLSQFRDEDLGHNLKVIQSPFSSISPDDSVPRFIRKGSSISPHYKDTIHSEVDASPPSTSIPIRSSHVDTTSRQKYILKELQYSLEVERPATRNCSDPPFSNDIWVGSGCISQFDMTISLHEINMILSSFESCSNFLVREGTSNVDSRHRSYSQEPGENMEEMVPDGTIVAIQDVDEHMYVTVRDVQSGYDISGEVHYSLVGERALFRVNYQKPGRWKSHTQHFSLISLYAKDNSGEPLRLSCQPRSKFVDVCSSGSGSSLWEMLPFKPDAYEDAVGLESSTYITKRAFHLVNKKNDCALAFIDGMLEFVSKPGNLFKWKVFDDLGSVRNSLSPNRFITEGLSSATPVSEEQGSPEAENLQSDSNVTDMGLLRTNGNLMAITVNVGKFTLTIVHELSETEEKFPLLQGCIMPNQTIVHISDVKVRIMDRFEVILYYFDGQQNSWKEFIQSLKICAFYSQKLVIQGAENPLHGGLSRFFANFKEVTISLTELSLDIVLFVVGKLNLAGPYAVKSSLVLANCCKVENRSGLTLLCQFYDSQDASISSRQSATIFLRHLALANQPPEASFFSLQFVQKALSTSLLHLSLLEARKFAWRTRIMSSQDSKSFPGPFLVVDISKGTEDGLLIIVSPLLMIHNETDFTMELRFQRAQSEGTDSASLILKAGDTVDDTMTAFNAVNLPGGSRKALTSLSVGNYVFSFRPHSGDGSGNFEKSSIEWSDELKGGKSIRLSGLFDKLSYQVRKAFSVDSTRFSLSTANCAVASEEGFVSNVYFLIQTVGKTIPVINPDNFGHAPGNKNSPVAMQEQKEIFILPTIKVANLLHTEIHVRLTDKDPHNTTDSDNIWSQATISCESAVNFYANPDTIYFVVTLTSFESSCKPVNSCDWVRKLQKQKGHISHLDIELDFSGGKYFAMLRLSRGLRGTLEVDIFTPYALQNDTNEPLFCFSAYQKPLNRDDMEGLGTSIPPGVGSFLPPHSIRSWFSKCHKLHLKLLEEKVLEATLDLDVLSGLAEIDLESEESHGSKDIMRLAVSVRASANKDSHIVSLSSRYVVCNDSDDVIAVRQCYMEDMEDFTNNDSKERIALRLKTVMRKKKVTSFIDNILKKHTKSQTDSSFFIQFRPNEMGLCWSGPICVASLGRFFVRFRKSVGFPETQSDNMSTKDNIGEFAAVHVVEEASTIVLHFRRPQMTNLPYRIENCLRDTPLTYYQKGGSSEPETLGAGGTIDYVWDDLTLPHKLVVQLDDVHLLREINLDKVRSWKSFYRSKQTRGLGLHLPLEKKPEDQKQATYSRLTSMDGAKVGFEVYAEGTTRVLRICEFSGSHKVNIGFRSSRKLRLRISYFSLHLLEYGKQEVNLGDPSRYAPIIIARLERINWDGIITNQLNYSQIRVQSLSVDEKWAGAPFNTMLRRHQSEKSDTNECVLHIGLVLLPTSYNVRQVKYLSIVLQPLDLNIDEDTLMRMVPFWRSSLSNSTMSSQYYFDHFEVHPIKIVASFLPGDSRYSYSSTQETLRSLLHSVIKIPAIQRKTVELNGVLVTHALITLKELTIKCAQHYSWYSMRAIYIAKGSPLLPPAFASIFDDLASSSLDVFFDPSTGLLNVPGVTLGTLKLISKIVDNKGFSGTKRYFGDLGKTLKTAGSNVLFAAVTEVSDSILRGAETNGFNGVVNGFHQGILKLAMEPSVLGSAFMEGGPDRKIKLDRSPGVDELYIEGYLQAMLDTMYKQEYLRVRVIENQVILKNLPPSSSLINEIMERVKGFLASKSLLKGESSSHSLQHIRGEREWRLGPTILTLCEHLFVSFMIRMLRKHSGRVIGRIKWRDEEKEDEEKAIDEQKVKFVWKWGLGKFVLSGIVAYIDGRLCRNIPHPLARRIVSGFLLSFLDQSDDETK
ncbi:hypothetical protein AAHA92_27610 [Salvia divinorum]|uniref:Vacuolar protein sorting-associated protein 13 VPS13 adaptor binding domain-containing protein n=1 Tax=Salvia divinorum TaxID=28513 RepID=A0ABD1G7E0_SALDI